MLIDAEARQRSGKVQLWLAALQPDVLAVVKRSPLGEALGSERMFSSLESAVERFRTQHGVANA
jgi:hypothetical protein